MTIEILIFLSLVICGKYLSTYLFMDIFARSILDVASSSRYVINFYVAVIRQHQTHNVSHRPTTSNTLQNYKPFATELLNIKNKTITTDLNFTNLRLVSRARERQSICALFLWMILTHPGGWSQASPSTCTGTHSSPRILIWTARHCAILCFCRLMRRDAAICADPKTATTCVES